ncbi:MAG: helix-turn-helix transcriptional regulator [Candidatus Dormibacteraeota bacterium]|nr:helix-turn-helix transcriptional regulator [Candidatus Dormibacteraeota bacterium]
MPEDTSREAVVAAARRACQGSREPTMDEIAAAAGVAVRTLYRMFGSRQALLREAGCTSAPTARQRVLEAALDLVGRHGLADLSMDELASAARVSRATLYRLFPGKSALFVGLMQAYSPWEPVADAIEAMPDGTPEEVMPAVGQAMAEAMEGRVGLLLRMVFELVRGDPDTAEGMRRSLARGLPDLIGYMSRQMAGGRLRRMHPVLAFQLLAGPIVAHLLTRPIAEPLIGFGAGPSEVVDQIVQAWLRAMAPEEEGDGEPG